jgi:ATP-dependent exoDNAse (exonuclease V) alpha subunit
VDELNEGARRRLVEAGMVERDGVDVRGTTIGVGDQVMILRNDRTLGVINGMTGTVRSINRDRGDLEVETSEPESRMVRLPRSF